MFYRQSAIPNFSHPTPSTTQDSVNTKAAKLTQAASTSHKGIVNLPLRRSERKPKAELLKKQMEEIEAKLLTNDDATLGIEIAYIENKGRGIKVWIVIRSWIYSKTFISKGCERFRQGRIRR